MGREEIKRMVVLMEAHENKLIFKGLLKYILFLRIEDKIFIELKIEERPFRWREKIIISIEVLFWLERGG
jgi:hypothetical protein